MYACSIYIRAEENPAEYRTPVVPCDIKKLIKYGFVVYVESSKNRIFNDEEYSSHGAIVVYEPWDTFSKKYYLENSCLQNNLLILGIKQFNNLENLNSHIHMYFSHSYKNQIGSQNILKYFSDSQSVLYDLEYFLDNNNKRLVAFGYHAGIVGCALGLINYYNKQLDSKYVMKNLKYYTSYNSPGLGRCLSDQSRRNPPELHSEEISLQKELVAVQNNKFRRDSGGVNRTNSDGIRRDWEDVYRTNPGGIRRNEVSEKFRRNSDEIPEKFPKIAIVGVNGRCGCGVVKVLTELNINFDSFLKSDSKDNLKEYDIVYNCILLENNIERRDSGDDNRTNPGGIRRNEVSERFPWFTYETEFTKPITIVDISCDYTNPYNPIKIYNSRTTWENPVYSYNQYVDIIAIDNLPSLLPLESSVEFSSQLVKLLLDYNNDKDKYWYNNYKIFKEKIREV